MPGTAEPEHMALGVNFTQTKKDFEARCAARPEVLLVVLWSKKKAADSLITADLRKNG